MAEPAHTKTAVPRSLGNLRYRLGPPSSSTAATSVSRGHRVDVEGQSDSVAMEPPPLSRWHPVR